MLRTEAVRWVYSILPLLSLRVAIDKLDQTLQQLDITLATGKFMDIYRIQDVLQDLTVYSDGSDESFAKFKKKLDDDSLTAEEKYEKLFITE